MMRNKKLPTLLFPTGLLLCALLLATLSIGSASPDTPEIGKQGYLPFMPMRFKIGTGIVTGKVVDARTGAPIDGASVNWGNNPPTITDGNGRYTLPQVPAGYKSFTAEAENYLEVNLPTRVFASQTNILNFAMSPDDLESEGQYRIIVTWFEDPPDLDAHLWTPDLINGRPHVFQENKGGCEQPNQTTACLDFDERHGVGPETITILEAQPGTYYFGVEKYEPACWDPTLLQFVECPQAIEESGAQVLVYDYQGLKENTIFTVPTAGNDMGDKFWLLFELKFGLGSEISFTPLGEGNGCFTDLPNPVDSPPQCPPPP